MAAGGAQKISWNTLFILFSDISRWCSAASFVLIAVRTCDDLLSDKGNKGFKQL